MALDMEISKLAGSQTGSNTLVEERAVVIIPDQLHGDRLRHVFVEGSLPDGAISHIEDAIHAHYIGPGQDIFKGMSKFVLRAHDKHRDVHRSSDELYAHLLMQQPASNEGVALRLHPVALDNPDMKDFSRYMVRQAFEK